MEVDMAAKLPELKNGHPIWWHHHGRKMEVSEQTDDRLIIKSNAARLTIQKASPIFPDEPLTKDHWFVDWQVVQCRPIQELVSGRRWLTRDDLRSAFGIIDDSGKYGKWLIDRYGADAAEQMKYIRWHEFLNIPCPGTGNDGDPNISIEISDEIQRAIAKLLI
jgi:hypothetical protein